MKDLLAEAIVTLGLPGSPGGGLGGHQPGCYSHTDSLGDLLPVGLEGCGQDVGPVVHHTQRGGVVAIAEPVVSLQEVLCCVARGEEEDTGLGAEAHIAGRPDLV